MYLIFENNILIDSLAMSYPGTCYADYNTVLAICLLQARTTGRQRENKIFSCGAKLSPPKKRFYEFPAFEDVFKMRS